MSREFLIVIGPPDDPGSRSEHSHALRRRSMRLHHDSSCVRIFVSEEMPCIRTADGDLILGDLFTNNFERIKSGSVLAGTPQGSSARDHVLNNYWGDYILVSLDCANPDDLTLLRSPFSRIPCIYSIHRGSGFITSDVSIATALSLYRKHVDWDFIPHCLSFTHLKTQRTALKGLRELLPGSVLHIRSSSPETEMAWSPWDYVIPDCRISDPHLAGSQLRRTVSGVVTALASADESILVELSGGLDSSIIAACLDNSQAGVSFCTLVTPVPGADERRYANLVTDTLQAELEVAVLQFGDALIDFPLRSEAVVPRVAALQYAIDQVITRVADRQRVKSLYSGGGGDTVFCYLNTAAPAADALKAQGLGAGLTAIHDLSELHQCTRWHAARMTLKKLLHRSKAPFPADSSFLNPDTVPLAADPHPWFDAPSSALPGDRERIFDLVGTQMYGDGAPRGRSRRMRFPLLSQPVVEHCLGVPTWLWIRDGLNRSVARWAFHDHLPPAVLNRRSKGNFVHYTGTVYQQNTPQIRSFLLDGELRAQGLLDIHGLERFFREPLRPREERFLRVLDLCMIENWIRRQS